jgi:hypothetical protein
MAHKMRNIYFIEYIETNFGSNPFAIDEIADPAIRKRIHRYCCFSVNQPNPISDQFETFTDNIKKKKMFKLKKSI